MADDAIALKRIKNLLKVLGETATRLRYELDTKPPGELDDAETLSYFNQLEKDVRNFEAELLGEGQLLQEFVFAPCRPRAAAPAAAAARPRAGGLPAGLLPPSAAGAAPARADDGELDYPQLLFSGDPDGDAADAAAAAAAPPAGDAGAARDLDDVFRYHCLVDALARRQRAATGGALKAWRQQADAEARAAAPADGPVAAANAAPWPPYLL